jgi:GSH-dependent disulfide-bond oxidoreductase
VAILASGGLGPTAGQSNHFRLNAPEKIPYAIDRYTKEIERLFGVMDKHLSDRPYLTGTYSIADIASFPWARTWKTLAQDITKFPNVERWLASIGERPAVVKGLAVKKG